MRLVSLGGLTAAERWPRLVGSLAASVAVHCAALSITGPTNFKLFLTQEGERPFRLMVALLPAQPQAQARLQPRTTVETPSHTLAASTETGDVARLPEPQQSGIPENISPHSSPTDASTSSGLFPGPWYYAARYLHRRPTPLKPIQPAYPQEAENLSGQVVLLLLINERGAVDSYQIIESQPAGRFDDPVIEAFTRETYAPGLITGYPVKSQLLVEVVFEPGALPEANILPDLTQFKIKAKPVPSARGN